jgi:hypothetical protein
VVRVVFRFVWRWRFWHDTTAPFGVSGGGTRGSLPVISSPMLDSRG